MYTHLSKTRFLSNTSLNNCLMSEFYMTDNIGGPVTFIFLGVESEITWTPKAVGLAPVTDIKALAIHGVLVKPVLTSNAAEI